MDENNLIYEGVSKLYEAAECFKNEDREFATYLLLKCKEYLEKIVVDEDVIKEIDEYAKQIKL